jgi:predicted metal-dependent hydrolase
VETTIESAGATATINLPVDGQTVKITVPKEVKAHFTNQFVRANPSKLQKQKYTTLMSLLRAAYKAGQASSN